MDTVILSARDVTRLLDIADRAGVKQGIDVVGPHDTVVVERVRNALRSRSNQEIDPTTKTK